jgi:anthranilate synthase component 2
MITLIDNYDSFTYNLVHYIGDLGISTDVVRNDKITVEEVIETKPKAIVLSPGPCTPNEAGICLELIKKAAGIFPIFGVCLGHQSIGQAFGGKVIKAPELMHGKTSGIIHESHSVFKGLPSPFTATRYHSLIVERESLPDCFDITAESEDGLIMGLTHKDYPIFGVQFHPESIASDYGHKILGNFLEIAGLSINHDFLQENKKAS